MRSIKRQTTDNLNIDWHAFYRNVFALIIPMALQNLINVGVTAVDVMMLGRVGEKVLSGSSLAGQIQFIMMLIFFMTREVGRGTDVCESRPSTTDRRVRRPFCTGA